MANPIITSLKIYIENFCVDNFNIKTINNIFDDAGFTRDESIRFENRRPLVNAFFESEDWSNSLAIEKLIKIIESILYNPQISETKSKFRTILQDFGFQIEGNQVIDHTIFPKNLSFKSQFPLGLPFGKFKPELVVKLENGGQISKFEWQDNIGIINFDVYPDLTYQKLVQNFGLHLGTTDSEFRKGLSYMNQTDLEKEFFIKYAQSLKMANENVPVLIPQAWIQWHSQSKKDLNSQLSLNKTDVYRVDFVAFWNNKRFAIFVDDISHYARFQEEKWLASEAEYSNNIQQDRKLIKQGWNVIRFSNWEIKQKELLEEIVRDLKEIIVFC